MGNGRVAASSGESLDATLRYLAKREPLPDGVTLFEDDGRVALLWPIEGRDGWRVRFVDLATREFLAWHVPEGISNSELYDRYLHAIEEWPTHKEPWPQ
jgi:hypothetical protein